TNMPATRRETQQPPSTPPDASAWKRAAGQGNPRPHPERRHADTRAQCEAAPRRIRSCRYPTHASEIEQPSQLLPLPGPCLGTEPAPRAATPARTIPRGPPCKKRTSEDEEERALHRQCRSAVLAYPHPERREAAVEGRTLRMQFSACSAARRERSRRWRRR